MKKGRPSKIDKIDFTLVEKCGQIGLTDKEIAQLLGIAVSTLNKYKKEYPDFMESLKRGKDYADENVILSLYKRATGYSHPDVHISNYQGVVTTTPIIKHYAPDVTACIFWLKNRRSAEWRDKVENLNMDIDLGQVDLENMSPREIDELYDKLHRQKDGNQKGSNSKED